MSSLKRRMPVFLRISVVIALMAPFFSLAHGVGESFERQVGEYLIDVGYNTFTITEEELVRFDFKLLNAASNVDVPFDTVTVRIRDEDRIVYAFDLARATQGPTDASITMPYAGVFTMSLDYRGNEMMFASTTFEFNVGRTEEKPDPFRFYLVPAALLLSMLLAYGTHHYINRSA